MFLPTGYHEIRTAAFLLPDREGFDDFDWKLECIGCALAGGELVAHGIVVGHCGLSEETLKLGEMLPIRPEVWRSQMGRDAAYAKLGDGRLLQDSLVLTPTIHETALFAWDETESADHQAEAVVAPHTNAGVVGLSSGVHAVPSGYLTFDAITRVARRWANDGKIDPELMHVLDPPDTDAMTQALATGSLRAFGISKRTGEIVPLPPAAWRMEVSGAPQSIWAIAGADVFAGPDGDPCLPVITRADLARCFEATEIPADPQELPVGWKAAVSLVKTKTSPTMDTHTWLRGVAQGYKSLGKTLKREDAVKLAMSHLGCTSRQAEAAFQALPYPELRNPPRAAAA